MDLKEVLSALRAAWWLPLLGLLIGGAAGVAIASAQTPLYSSSVEFFVRTTTSSSTTEAYQGSQFSQQRVASYARLVAGEEIASRVVDRLGLAMDPRELAEHVSATPLLDTVLIEVVVTDESAESARDIARAVSAEFTDFVAELETPEGQTASPVKVTVTKGADLPTAPSSPDVPRSAGVGLLIGVLGGSSLAVLKRRLDRSLKTVSDVESLVDASVIGTVMRDAALEEHHTINRASSSRASEDFRQLRTNLQFLNVDQPPKAILVTSALPAEGKTTLVVNLALALVDAGKTVTIIEGDLRRPKVTRYLGLVGGAGLTNILAGAADVDDVLQVTGDGTLRVVGSGPTPPNPGELLASTQMSALIDKLRAGNDYILVDAPPLLPVADASGLAVLVDGVLLACRYGKTTRDQFRQAVATLERVGAETLGVVFNVVPRNAEIAAAYGYEYNYSAEGRHSEG